MCTGGISATSGLFVFNMNIVFYLYLFVGHADFWPSGDLDVNLNEFHDLILRLDSIGCDSSLTFTY